MEQIILSLVTAIFVGGIAGYLGSLMTTRRMALTAGPLGHLALPGVALALLYNFNIFLGSLISIGIGAFSIWILSTRTRVPLESITAIIFATGVAIGFLFLPLSHAEEALVGNISRINSFDTIISAIFFFFIFFTISKVYSKITLIEISEDLAKSQGIDINKLNLIYLISVGFLAALEVKIVGTLLTAALVAIPAAASRNISRNLKSYSISSTVFGIVMAISGIAISNILNVSAGPIIILVGFIVFVLSLFAKK